MDLLQNEYQLIVLILLFLCIIQIEIKNKKLKKLQQTIENFEIEEDNRDLYEIKRLKIKIEEQNKIIQNFKSVNDEETVLSFILDKKAKNMGADRYQCCNDENFSIYFPQSLSRDDNNPKQDIKIKIV